MKGILVVAFWCWFAMSLGIYFRRAVRKASGRTATPKTEQSTITARTLRPAAPTAAADAETATIAPDASAGAGTRDAGSIFVRDAAARAGTDGAGVRTLTIADALEGIRMPCDLTPLTGVQSDFDRRVAFVTAGYPAAAVAPEVADELERLGMSFNAMSETTALAERDDVRVKIAVRTVGPAINGIPDPDYPTAPEHSVVVEFELV